MSSETQVRGTKPIFLVDKIIRNKAFNSVYYKEHCFGLDAKNLIDKAVELKYIGGTSGGARNATPFMCLVVKLLQIYPEKQVLLKYIEQSEYKYLRALGAFVWRLVASPKQVFETLEPLYNDYRKIRVRQPDSSFVRSHMDEYIEDLLYKEVVFEIALPSLPKRHILEEMGELPRRKSALEGQLEIVEPAQSNEPEPKPKIKRNRVRLGEGNKNPQKEPVPESTEYWNNIRAQLGLPPLKSE